MAEQGQGTCRLKTWMVSMFRALLASMLLGLPCSAALAGNIYFGLNRTENRLQITNQGNSIAYYPQVLRLTPAGEWEPLPYPPGRQQPPQLLPGSQFETVWIAPKGSGPTQSILAVMIRFFDQAGAGIGQISFFNRPPDAGETLQAAYIDSRLVIQPPAGGLDIQTTWLLWGYEDGITPLAEANRFEHFQPRAPRIEWRSGSAAQSFETGRAQPVVMLLHETRNGYRLQTVSSQIVRGREQHAFWLGQEQKLYQAGLASLVAAFVIAALGVFSRRRTEKT